jgi:hypothetical protein
MRDAAQKQRLEPTPPASSDQDRLRVDLGRDREDRVRNASYGLLGSGSVAIPSLPARSAPSGSVAKALALRDRVDLLYIDRQGDIGLVPDAEDDKAMYASHTARTVTGLLAKSRAAQSTADCESGEPL